MMRRSSFLFAVLFLAWRLSAQTTTDLPAAASASRPLEHARQLAVQGKFDAALQELDALRKQPPEPAGLERLRGFIYYQQNLFNEADTAFIKALEQNPHDVEAMQLRGVTLYRMGKPADAIPLLEQAHAAIPGANIDPNYVLGVSYLQLRRNDDARHAFAAQYGFPPDSAAAYLLTARLCLHQELLPVADEFANKALQLNPKLPLAHLLLGEIALARGSNPAAIEELEKEQQINPLLGAVYDRLGDAYVRSGEYDKAQHALNRAILIEPNATGPYILLGKVLLFQQNPVMATLYLERAAKMDPGNYITHSLLGQAYRTEGRREDATREFQILEKLQPPTPSTTTPQ